MAKKATGKTTPGDVTAAHQWLEDASLKLSKHQGALKAHIDFLEDENGELNTKLVETETQFQASIASLSERYTRDVTALKATIAGLEKKLDKVKADLS